MTFRKSFEKLVLALNGIAMLACFATVLIVAADVALRKVSGARLSVPGSSELSASFLVVICMLAIPALQVKRGHIWISMFPDRLRFRNRWLAAVRLLECAVCALLAWGGAAKTRLFFETGTTTDVLNLPKWLFALFVLIGFGEMTVLTALEAAELLRTSKEKKQEDAG